MLQTKIFKKFFAGVLLSALLAFAVCGSHNNPVIGEGSASVYSNAGDIETGAPPVIM